MAEHLESCLFSSLSRFLRSPSPLFSSLKFVVCPSIRYFSFLNLPSASVASYFVSVRHVVTTDVFVENQFNTTINRLFN